MVSSSFRCWKNSSEYSASANCSTAPSDGTKPGLLQVQIASVRINYLALEGGDVRLYECELQYSYW